jgi:hypothetical protein
MKRPTLAARRPRWAAAPLTALAVALPLAACGGSSTTASPAAFCATFKQQRSDPDQLWAGLGATPDFSAALPSGYALEVIGRLMGLLDRLDAEAPATVRPAMTTITQNIAQIRADYHHGSTVGQVVDYVRQHPPSTSGTAAAEHSLAHFLATTCHITG